MHCVVNYVLFYFYFCFCVCFHFVVCFNFLFYKFSSSHICIQVYVYVCVSFIFFSLPLSIYHFCFYSWFISATRSPFPSRCFFLSLSYFLLLIPFRTSLPSVVISVFSQTLLFSPVIQSYKYKCFFFVYNIYIKIVVAVVADDAHVDFIIILMTHWNAWTHT